MTPQTSREAVLNTCSFERYHRILSTGSDVIDAAVVHQQTTVDVQETLRRAVEAMRQELFEGLSWQCGALQDHPLAEVREWGSILFAGVMRSMINMYFPGLRDALAQEGNPEEVLLQRLPPTGYASWHGGSRESLERFKSDCPRAQTE